MKGNKRLKLMAAAAAALLLALALVWWLSSHRSGQATQIQGRTDKVVRGTIRRLVVSTGTVKAQVGAEVKVGARVSGRVEKLLASIGQTVKAGQVVAVIEHQDLKAKLDQAQAELAAYQARRQRVITTGPKEIARARAELNEAKATLQLTSLDLKRQQQMRKGDLVAQDAVDRAQERQGVAEARVASATARLAQTQHSYQQDLKVAQADVVAARARLASAQVNLDYATVRAPINGVVSSVTTQEGETVAASLSAPTFITIVDLSRLQVDDFVDETDIGRVKVAQEATFTVDAYAGQQFKGVVDAIQPSAKIVDDVVYYDVVIKILGNYQGLLKPEMTATVSIVTGVRENVLTVPAEAVRQRGNRGLVYVREGDQIRAQPVQVGWTESGRVQILNGLSEGQEIIVPKASSLKDVNLRR
ncbi:MAG: efflux RND transporter periplasmic adaptor subunit [Desulfarculus sp.]|nr:MAG: efflux RND transporter periplasmic adaptor subunit [Desulfarculus sp.]